MAKPSPSERFFPSQPKTLRFLAKPSPSEWISNCEKETVRRSARRREERPSAGKPMSWGFLEGWRSLFFKGEKFLPLRGEKRWTGRGNPFIRESPRQNVVDFRTGVPDPFTGVNFCRFPAVGYLKLDWQKGNSGHRACARLCSRPRVGVPASAALIVSPLCFLEAGLCCSCTMLS